MLTVVDPATKSKSLGSDEVEVAKIEPKAGSEAGKAAKPLAATCFNLFWKEAVKTHGAVLVALSQSQAIIDDINSGIAAWKWARNDEKLGKLEKVSGGFQSQFGGHAKGLFGSEAFEVPQDENGSRYSHWFEGL